MQETKKDLDGDSFVKEYSYYRLCFLHSWPVVIRELEVG